MSQKQASGASAASAILGEMVWLYSMSDLHRDWTISSIHQWVLPAIQHQHFRVYRKGAKPVALITWAWLSAEIETAYVRNPSSLRPQDWKSGDRLWLLDLIAPFGDTRHVVSDVRATIFKNEVGRFLRAKKGADTMKIMYVHGKNAVDKARDRNASPTVALSSSPSPAS